MDEINQKKAEDFLNEAAERLAKLFVAHIDVEQAKKRKKNISNNIPISEKKVDE